MLTVRAEDPCTPTRRLLSQANNETAQLRAIISNLYMLIVQAHDYQGTGTQQAMQEEMYAFSMQSTSSLYV